MLAMINNGMSRSTQSLQHDVDDANDVAQQIHVKVHMYNDMPVQTLCRDLMQRRVMHAASVVNNNVVFKMKLMTIRLNNLLDALQ